MFLSNLIISILKSIILVLNSALHFAGIKLCVCVCERERERDREREAERGRERKEGRKEEGRKEEGRKGGE